MNTTPTPKTDALVSQAGITFEAKQALILSLCRTLELENAKLTDELAAANKRVADLQTDIYNLLLPMVEKHPKFDKPTP